VEANVAGSNPVSHPKMIIKPLEEKNNRPSIYRVLFLITLVATGILLDKIFLKQSKDIPSILGKTQEIQLQAQEEVVRQVQDNNLVKDSINKVEEVGGVVLGEATNTLTKLTSDAGSLISTVIYDNSIGKVVDQISKLPKDQQEKIKEQICK
jgi:hypothetical protein